jgi:hypothetical protein
MDLVTSGDKRSNDAREITIMMRPKGSTVSSLEVHYSAPWATKLLPNPAPRRPDCLMAP